jgi:hypothetical protein
VELNFTSTEELASFNEADKEEAWWVTMCEAVKAIKDNNTLDLIALPIGHQVIGLKLVYK